MSLRIFVIMLCLIPRLRGAEADDLLRQAATAEAHQDSHQALKLFLHADRLRPDDPLILQKIARQYSDLAAGQPDLEGKKDYAQTALNYSQRASALNPRDPVNLLSLAVCHGKLALWSNTRDKVRYSRLVRDEAEQALALNPNYAWAHHVLGRWNLEVATLAAPSRFIVKLLYGDLPSASIEEAIRHLQRATELEPDELNHWFELGLACLAAGKRERALMELQRGLALPSRGPYDELAKQTARNTVHQLE